MTMSVRAKMTLSSITEEHWGPNPGSSSKTLNFTCTYDTSIPEDQRFQKATPSGSAKFQIDNPGALEQFVAGQSYYLDFSPVPKS
jgi:hypothetical protein